MRFPTLFALAAVALAVPAVHLFAAPASAEPTAGRAGVSATPGPVFEGQLQNFDEPSYNREVERLIAQFEVQSGKKVAPGAKRKVGLKVYSDSGIGLATPHPLVKAVIASLERRGFQPENIFLVGLNQLRLRWSGFLPDKKNGESQYKGHPVYILDSGRYYDSVWFYDSPLPKSFDAVFAESQMKDVPATSNKEEDQRSFLATPLFLDADFWINLPVFTDHRIIGVNGALVNASLWNASNTARFFRSPASAPAAVAEMSAIPELRSNWLFTIASLERYQFIDGPYFNSIYTATEPLVWLSTDPVIMDALMMDRMNRWRKRNGFPPISPDIPTLGFAEQLGVGSANLAKAKIIKVDE